MHKDLCLRNLLLTKELQVKLCNFGEACRLSNDLGTDVEGYFNENMAPEQRAGTGYSYQVDVFQLGIIMYELFFKHLPFHMGEIETPSPISKKIQKTPLPRRSGPQ